MRTTTDRLPGLTVTNLFLDVPLDHASPDGPAIEVFAKVVSADGGDKLPYLLFLQGGPGHESPRPGFTGPLWMDRALRSYRLVLLDQRGTGRSTPISGPDEGPLNGLTATEQADYLTHFRADEIVNDAERIRQALGVRKWTLLGQSFGGFTALHYLSTRADSLEAAILTGGLPAVGRPIDDIYAHTWELMITRSLDYYRRFPADRERMSDLSRHCAAGEVTLPNGDLVAPDRFRTIGHMLGVHGGFERLHHLLELDHTSAAFRHDLAGFLPFGGRNPLYAVLHESSYADGVVTGWSADRTMPDRLVDDPTLLGGEHLHRSLFAQDHELAGYAGVADLVAAHQWNQLYPPEGLAKADVPVAAVIYHGDLYVPSRFSLETAALLPDCRTWVTSEFEHNGLRTNSVVLDRLISLLSGDQWQ